MRPRTIFVGAITFALLLGAFALATTNDQEYRIEGSDSFAVGAGEPASETRYRGTQRLAWTPLPHGRRYVETLRYDRITGDVTTIVRARGVSDLTAEGDQHDRVVDDPEYLGVLGQPFSVQLDLATLRELRTLTTDLPFDFPSPMTGTPLHGRLRHLALPPVAGRRVVGVGFAADGSMTGALPDRPGLAIRGVIALRGYAAYDAATALLLDSHSTVTIVGAVTSGENGDPVHITYVRSLVALQGSDSAP